MPRLPLLVASLTFAACANEDPPPSYTPTPLPTTCTAAQEGNQRCNGTLVQTCTAGTWGTNVNCRDTSQVCQAAGTTASCVTASTCTCNVNATACDPGCSCDPLCGGADGAYEYCTSFWAKLCARAFNDCGAELDDMANDYSSAVECAADHGCPLNIGDSYDYVPANGSACLTLIDTSVCSVFDGPEPEVCENALVEKPFTGTCTTITLGTTNGALIAADPLYEGGHADAYCVAFTAGQAVTITTAAGTGTAVEDTVLTLLNPGGTVIEQNDDYDEDFYSQIVTTITTAGTYTIIVSGFDNSELGTYTLTVASD